MQNYINLRLVVLIIIVGVSEDMIKAKKALKVITSAIFSKWREEGGERGTSRGEKQDEEWFFRKLNT